LSKRRPFVNSTLVSVLALAVVVPVFLVASSLVLQLIGNAYRVETQIRRAQVLASRLLVLQLDEETAIRGFLNIGQREFLEPYVQAVPEFADVSILLEGMVHDLDVPGGSDAVRQVVTVNREWRVRIAQPILAQAHPRPNLQKARAGKGLIDEERTALKQLTDELSDREVIAHDQTSAGFLRATLVAVFSTLLIGGAILAFGITGSRYEAELDRERKLVEKLQQAFLRGWDALPGAAVGTTYVSATREALIGGDLFDVRRLDDQRGYFLVADVSGKGIDAAVDTAFIKFSIRALAQEATDPGAVLTAFNRLITGSLSNPDAFVVAFLGYLDVAGATLRYASAAHAAAFLRRGDVVTELAITGPILGLNVDDTFDSKTVALEPGDLIVLATDGLTEARDPRGTMLGEATAGAWIAEAHSVDTQAIADELVQRLRAFVASNRLKDDLALVVVRFEPGKPAAPASARA